MLNLMLNTLQKMQETLSVGLPQINADIEWQNFIEVPTTLVPASQFNPEAPDNIYTEMQFGIPIPQMHLLLPTHI